METRVLWHLVNAHGAVAKQRAMTAKEADVANHKAYVQTRGAWGWVQKPPECTVRCFDLAEVEGL